MVAWIAEVDRGVPESGFGMVDVALRAGEAQVLLEAERPLEELKCCVDILVEQVRRDRLGHRLLLRRLISVSMASSRFVQKPR